MLRLKEAHLDRARIAETLTTKSSEELAQMLAAPADQYEPEALELAREELARRPEQVATAAPGALGEAGARCSDHGELPAVATCSRCGRFYCASCRGSSRRDLCGGCEVIAGQPQPMNGWMILAGFGLFVRPVFYARTVWQFLAELRQVGWPTTPVNGRWLAFQVWTLVAEGAIALLALYIVPRYVGKRANIPKLMIAYFSLLIGYDVLDPLIGLMLGGDPHVVAAVIRVVVCALWVSYFAKSSRVKATFVR